MEEEGKGMENNEPPPLPTLTPLSWVRTVPNRSTLDFGQLGQRFSTVKLKIYFRYFLYKL
jgi:hypothetical protein